MLTSADTVTEALLDGRYLLQEPVGTGGMATVYRAADVVLGRTVAIKMIRQDGADMAPVERARLEESALASLDHPGIVTLFDSRLAPGRPRYLVLEFVDGPTLRTRLTRGRMPVPEVAELAADLADALRVVHEAGLVHRDLTPSNIILRAPRHEGGTASPVIVDFGISAIVGDPRLTSPGIVLGTLSYIAPELLRGAEATSAVDVYALGLILIEALSGRPAYAPGEGVESALGRLAIPPEIPEDLPAGWASLLRRMTSIEPDARPSATEIGRMLRALDMSVLPAEPASAPSAASTAPTMSTASTAVIAPSARTRSPREGSRRVRRIRRRSALMLQTALGLTAVGALALGAALTAPVEVVGRNSEGVVPRTSPSVVVEQVSSENPGTQDAMPIVDPESEQTANVPADAEAPLRSNGKEPDHAHSPGGKDGNGGNNGKNENGKR